MKTRSNTLKRLFALMPPLTHQPGDSNAQFRMDDSEVLQWIKRNPELIYHLFDRARQTNSIRFDPSTGKWSGLGAEAFKRDRSPRPDSTDRKPPGRPRNFDSKDIVNLLPQEPLSAGKWAQKCLQDLGLPRRTFANIKKRAISEGLIAVQLRGREVLCSRTPETMENRFFPPSVQSTSGFAGTVATAETIEK